MAGMSEMEPEYKSEIFLDLSIYSMIGILISGAIFLASNFLQEIELVETITSSWIKIGTEYGVVVPSILLITIGSAYLGYFFTVNHLSLITEGTNLTVAFPVPFILMGIGSSVAYYSYRLSKREKKRLITEHKNASVSEGELNENIHRLKKKIPKKKIKKEAF